MHDAIERQLAASDPPEVAAAIARLQREGLDRHAAVHAAAAELVHKMWEVASGAAEFDRAGYAAALSALRADDLRTR
jgi:hypothetical protein